MRRLRPEVLVGQPGEWRGREWRRMLDEGVYPHQSALARGEGVSAAAVSAALKKMKAQEGAVTQAGGECAAK